jgi:hypothetical protein
MRTIGVSRTACLFVSSAVSVLTLAGCSGGGGGSSGGGTMEVVGASAENIGLLPQSGLFLNQRLVFEFTADVDAATVSPETFRIRRGPTFSVQASGDFLVRGNRVTFVPTLPTRRDLTDAGLTRGAQYRIQIMGFPNGQTVKNRRGRPLSATFTTTFGTRNDPPLLRDIIPGAPRVIAVLLDLDGDGVLRGNGSCGPQRQPEQFLDANAAEFRGCGGSPDLVDFRNVPFVANVRVGSAAGPTAIGLIFSEPLLLDSVLQDDEDLTGDGFPDGDGQPDNFIISDLTNRIDSDGDGIPDVPRQIPVRLEFHQEFQTQFGENGRYFAMATLTPPFTIRASRLRRERARSLLGDAAHRTALSDERPIPRDVRNPRQVRSHLDRPVGHNELRLPPIGKRHRRERQRRRVHGSPAGVLHAG